MDASHQQIIHRLYGNFYNILGSNFHETLAGLVGEIGQVSTVNTNAYSSVAKIVKC